VEAVMFNEAHWHIAINHLPVVGYLIALLIAISGLFIKDRMLNLIAWMVTIFSSLTGIVAYLSGEPAEEVVQEIDGISYAYLSAHARWGEWTYYAAIGVGVLALAGWFRNRTMVGGCRKCMFALTVMLLAANALCVVTAATGGGVRHTEAHGDAFCAFIEKVAMQPELENGMFEEEAEAAEAEHSEEIDLD
jgi:hypothetical protein